MLAMLHSFYSLRAQLRHRDHHAHGAGARLHVPAQPQAGAQCAEDAGAAARDQDGSPKNTRKPEDARQAQQELFRKHNYNPFGGCLPVFVQLPIFVGLYRSLMVDVELRQAPLISEADPLGLEPGRARHALELELAGCRPSSSAGSDRI